MTRVAGHFTLEEAKQSSLHVYLPITVLVCFFEHSLSVIGIGCSLLTNAIPLEHEHTHNPLPCFPLTSIKSWSAIRYFMMSNKLGLGACCPGLTVAGLLTQYLPSVISC